MSKALDVFISLTGRVNSPEEWFLPSYPQINPKDQKRRDIDRETNDRMVAKRIPYENREEKKMSVFQDRDRVSGFNPEAGDKGT
jgi:hypothetical protein